MGERLTEELWRSIEPTYAAILEHPFIAGLRDGSLPPEAFRAYVVQDALYLRQYARALSLTAAKAPDEASIAMFDEHAAGALEVERSLHESFFRDFGLAEDEVRSTPLSPTNLAYTSFLLATCSLGSFAECLGAVLPCYWIYWEVGKELLGAGSDDPLYARWIDTYGGEGFGALVQAVLDLTDEAGADLGAAERARVGEHFRTTSRYEWLFWDAGWRQETWPV